MEATLTLIEKTAFIKSTALFQGIPTEVLARIAARAGEMHFDAGQTIFREGDSNTGVYMVVEGLVEIRKGRALEGMRGPGLGFGEMALNEGEPHVFTAVANQHTHVLNVSSEIFFDTVLDHPEVGVGMVRALGKRLSEMAQRLHYLEGHIAHLSAVLREAGVEAPPYVSGTYTRPDSG